MSVTASTPAAPATTHKTSRHFVKKPSQDEKNETIKEIEANIEKIRPRLNAVRDAIAGLNDKSDSDPRTPLRKRQKQKDKQAKLDQLTALENSLKKKIADLKVTQDKLPFKTQEAVDAQIIRIWITQVGREKRVLSEISSLKKTKKTVEAVQIQAELDEINKVKEEGMKKRNDLFDERTRLQKELDAEYQRKKTVNDEYFAALREYQKFQQEEQVRKREEGERLAIAKEERELAEIPAYTNEITLCDSVYRYLLQFSNDEKRIAEAAVAAPSEASTLNIRQADTTTNVPSGVMLKKKADKEEEVFFVGKSKKNKGPKEKKTEIVVPTSPADLGKTLDALTEKKEYFKANQAKATEENKRKAEERIAKLTSSDNTETEATPVKVTEIEATACINGLE
ncbi:hypothetical protein BCR41DRAFT_356724 [Lobosporangium transversale]|uniref:Nuclear segregation protein Bfr1 n=1 Tax=Lobosporangium transversale TaxID=64571 RepID=A0A1Y2GKG6_9FUNG|nr:hypothetical protein BCR41DRAFT_356724 [Lobosporangium transversale]ORZ11667.1 hypothetical protein BCR41DRAFT_356724 [Lobosporangium transversale]|eukprot:XP_021879764.1 hypothetical protein BCR41DRAFT_356724 [Lobosporangium transversale]